MYVRHDAICKTTLNKEPDSLESSVMVACWSKPQRRRINPELEQAFGQSNQAADQSQSPGSQNCNYELGVVRSARFVLIMVNLVILSVIVYHYKKF